MGVGGVGRIRALGTGTTVIGSGANVGCAQGCERAEQVTLKVGGGAGDHEAIQTVCP